MRNAVLAIALAGAGLIALPSLSHADSTNGFFINGNIGQSNLSKGAYDDNDTGYGANVGYRWAVAPNALVGLEGGYTDLGSFSPRNGFRGLGLGNADVKGWNLGVNGHFNLTPNWYLSGRTGYFRADVRGAYLDGAGLPVYVDGNANKWYAGAGFGYDFNSNFSVGLNYDYYKANKNGLDFNPSMVSVSAEYRF